MPCLLLLLLLPFFLTFENIARVQARLPPLRLVAAPSFTTRQRKVVQISRASAVASASHHNLVAALLLASLVGVCGYAALAPSSITRVRQPTCRRVPKFVMQSRRGGLGGFKMPGFGGGDPRASSSGLQHFALANRGWAVVVAQLGDRDSSTEEEQARYDEAFPAPSSNTGWRGPLADARAVMAWIKQERGRLVPGLSNNDSNRNHDGDNDAMFVVGGSSEGAETAVLLALQYRGRTDDGGGSSGDSQGIALSPSSDDFSSSSTIGESVDAVVVAYPQRLLAVAADVVAYQRQQQISRVSRPDSVELALLPPTLLLAGGRDAVAPLCLDGLVSFEDLYLLSGSVAAAGNQTAWRFSPRDVGSVLVLDGNGANVAKHCVPSVSSDRVSITFRKIGSRIKMTPFEGPHGTAPPSSSR